MQNQAGQRRAIGRGTGAAIELERIHQAAAASQDPAWTDKPGIPDRFGQGGRKRRRRGGHGPIEHGYSPRDGGEPSAAALDGPGSGSSNREVRERASFWRVRRGSDSVGHCRRPPAGRYFRSRGRRVPWTPLASQEGAYQVVFQAVDVAGETGSAAVAIEVGDGEPVVTRVVNAASRSAETACSPGAIASLEGRWLSQESPAEDPSGASLRLGGASVLVNGTAAPILYSSERRVDFLCPPAPPGTPLQIILQSAGEIAPTVETIEQAMAPGIFSVDGSGAGQGLVAHDDDSTLAMIRNYRYASLPALAGDQLVVYATGVTEAAHLLVEIGDTRATVESITPVPGKPGLFLIAVATPQVSGSAITAAVRVTGELPGGSAVRSNPVSIALEEGK